MQTNFTTEILCEAFGYLIIWPNFNTKCQLHAHFQCQTMHELDLNRSKRFYYFFSVIFMRCKIHQIRWFKQNIWPSLCQKVFKRKIWGAINLYRSVYSFNGFRARLNRYIFVIEISKWVLALKWKYLHGFHDYCVFILLSLTQI